MGGNRHSPAQRYEAQRRRDEPDVQYMRRTGSGNGRKKGNGINFAVISVLTVIISVIGLLLFGAFSSYLNLDTINVIGSGDYTEEQIISSAGIKMGTKLYSVNAKKIKQGILNDYYDIADVRVKKKLPSEISIEIIFEEPRYFVKVTGEYFTVSKDLKVLEKCKDRKSAESKGIIYLEMPNIKRCVTGDNIGFLTEDYAYIEKFLSELSASPFAAEINRIYIKNKFDISIAKSESYIVKLGDKNDGALKLKMADKVLDAGSYRDMSGVVVDVSNVSESSVKVDKLLKIE